MPHTPQVALSPIGDADVHGLNDRLPPDSRLRPDLTASAFLMGLFD